MVNPFQIIIWNMLDISSRTPQKVSLRLYDNWSHNLNNFLSVQTFSQHHCQPEVNERKNGLIFKDKLILSFCQFYISYLLLQCSSLYFGHTLCKCKILLCCRIAESIWATHIFDPQSQLFGSVEWRGHCFKLFMSHIKQGDVLIMRYALCWWYSETGTKWLPFCRWHSEIHFCMKLLYIDSNIAEICSWVSN